MRRLELFPFRYRDELTGKWKRARYVAELHIIAKRFAEFEILGPPEVREGDQGARYFSPHRPAVIRESNLGPVLTIAGWRQPRRAAVAGWRQPRRVAVAGVAA